MQWVPAVFAFFVAAAGFFYVQHAGRAALLADLEGERENRRRIQLRRVGGGAMIVLAIAFYVGIAAVDQKGSPALILACLTLVVLLLPVILFLAFVDLRMTRKMREAIKKNQQ